MLLAYLPNCLTFPPSFHPPACGSGVAADVIPNLKRDFGVAIVDLMFLDHSAASYVSDVAVASAQNFLAAGDDQTPFFDALLYFSAQASCRFSCCCESRSVSWCFWLHRRHESVSKLNPPSPPQLQPFLCCSRPTLQRPQLRHCRPHRCPRVQLPYLRQPCGEHSFG